MPIKYLQMHDNVWKKNTDGRFSVYKPYKATVNTLPVLDSSI